MAGNIVSDLRRTYAPQGETKGSRPRSAVSQRKETHDGGVPGGGQSTRLGDGPLDERVDTPRADVQGSRPLANYVELFEPERRPESLH
jgi:hypothetical protein